ncbi:MAG TPA: glycosyltransferase [Pirellulales bacterium]|nr:glycosyltransferase [Pirellulales bacterium]
MIPMLYLAAVDWASIRQRPQHLGLRMAQRYTLSYVNPVGLRSIRFGDLGRVARRARGGGGESAPFPLLDPWYVPLVGMPGFDEANRRWLFHQIACEFPLDQRPWILWLCTPSLLAEALLDRSRPSLVVYDCMDRYAAFHKGRDRARIERAERRVVERADVIVASSRALADSPALGGREALHVGNGVEYAAFALDRRPEPPAWRTKIAGPVIGYHGTLGDWLDFDLLEWLALQRPAWTFVFIGPNGTRRGGRLFSLPNVLRLGPIPYAELPAHTAHFDVGIVPFELNELTRHVHPIKALEYLAAGVPTVSSALADLADVAGVVSFAASPRDWLTALEAAIEPASRGPERVAARRAAAQVRSWDHAAQRIAARLEAALAARSLSENSAWDGLPRPSSPPDGLGRPSHDGVSLTLSVPSTQVSDLDVGIVYSGERHFMPPLLTTMSAAAADLSVRLLLVDNASRDGTAQWQAGFARTTTLVNATPLGYGANLNRILATSTAPYVLLMNTDMYFDPAEPCLAEMVRFMEAHPDCGVGSCRLYRPDGGYGHPARRFQTARIIAGRRFGLGKVFRGSVADYLYRRRSRFETFDCDWVSGCFLFVRRAAYAEVGGFDLGFKKYFEDVDFCARVAQAGWRVMFHGGTYCYHHEQRASRRLFSADAWRHAMSYLRWLRKWGVMSASRSGSSRRVL